MNKCGVASGWPARIGLLAAGAVVILGALAGPAFAHIEAEAEPAQAGAANAKITFTAESESQTAGITGLRVQLPAGIAPADVKLASGPTGWRLSATADGYEVSGPAVRAGEDAVYAITIAKLPDNATTVLFKSIQRYSDGHEDAWIQEPTPGGAEPDNPAPAITLAAGAGSATSAPATSAAPTSAAPTNAASAPASDGGTPIGLWIGIIAAVVVVGGGIAFWLRRRSGATSA